MGPNTACGSTYFIYIYNYKYKNDKSMQITLANFGFWEILSSCFGMICPDLGYIVKAK